jgi:co-chaperonin GroES (HSP10)
MESVKHPIVRVAKQYEDEIVYKSLTLYFDPSYNPEKNIRQHGIMEADFKDLRKGEIVYFHYLSVDPSPQLPPNCWLIAYGMLYCVIRDDKIVMLNKYNLITIEEEKEKSSLITIGKTSTTQGFIAHTSHKDLKIGDEVLFRPRAAFVNEIENQEFYLVESEDILCIIK